MRSPSSFRLILTVPCVDGCDGPIWISMGCAWRSSVSGGLGPASIALAQPRLGALGLFLGHVADGDQRLALLLGVVLAQRMTLELRVEVDAPQIRMPLELDTVHVVGLALEPVRAPP